MSIDVTYIVPVYNALPHLRKTVESILGQDYPQEAIEAIFVDDGSTDGSGAFLDEAAGQYSHMRVYHIEASGGPSTPRNIGLEHAAGEYVFFCDADDWMEPDATKRMMAHAREWDCDIMLVKPKGENGRAIASRAFERTMPHTNVYDSDICQALGPCKLFRRSLLADNDLSFKWRWSVWEDQPFVLEAYVSALRMSVAGDGVYCHWVRRDEEDQASDARDRIGFESAVEYLATMFAICEKSENRDKLKERLSPRILREGLHYAGRALNREKDSFDVQLEFNRLYELVKPYFTDRFYQLNSARRCLMYKAFCERDVDAWMEICSRDRFDSAFEPSGFAIDDDRQAIRAVWNGGSLVIDACGRLPLAFSPTEIRWGESSELIVAGEIDRRALYGAKRAALRVAKRDQGWWADVPMSITLAVHGAGKLTGTVPASTFIELGRAKHWDFSISISYENGRVKRQRIRVGDGVLARLPFPAVIANGSVALVFYSTPTKALSAIDCLVEARASAQRRIVGSVVELRGIPERAYEVFGSVRVSFSIGGTVRTVPFSCNGTKRVAFSAWKSVPAIVV